MKTFLSVVLLVAIAVASFAVADAKEAWQERLLEMNEHVIRGQKEVSEVQI